MAEPGAYATTAERVTKDRRAAVKRLLKMRVDAGVSVNRAIDDLMADAREGALPEPVAALLRTARDARGLRSGDGWVSKATLKRLYVAETLLPRPSALPDLTVKPWHSLAIGLRARPQGSCKRWVWQEMTRMWHPGLGEKAPTEEQVLYFFSDKYSKGDQHEGRLTGSALRSKKFYQHRTAAGLPPFTEVHADGWTTHFTAPHPVDGGFVTHELWHFQCIATKYLTPMAIGLSECTEVIAKGIENCIRVGGVPAILQTDSTGSIKNQRMEFDPISSLSARAGMTIVHPVTVGNSQANGIAENLNAWLDRECRVLATYQGKSMDSLVFKRQRKLTAKMVAARSAGDMALAAQIKAELERVTKGRVFETYADMVAFVRALEHKWNNKPHGALPKVRDPATGRMRHMTPQESLDAALAAGWQAVSMDEADLVDLFRVHEKRKVTRETVLGYGGQRYYHPELKDYDGEMVMVAIDRMEWEHVWVKDMAGRLLCQAKYVHVTGYRALTMLEMSLERRTEAAIKRLEDKAQVKRDRIAEPPLELEAPAITLDLSPLAATRREAQPEPLLQAPLRPPEEPPAELPPPPPRAKREPEPRQLDVIETRIAIEAMKQERLAREAKEAAAEAEKKAREAAEQDPAPPQAAAG